MSESEPEGGIPEPIPDKPTEATGEISMLPPAEALKVAAEIRAIAETRGEDSEVFELVELASQPSGRMRRTSTMRLPPMPDVQPAPAGVAPEDEQLSFDELR